MSAAGQSRHFDGLPMTSGLHPEADIVRPVQHVRKVPNPDSCTAANSELSITSLARARSGRRTVRSSGLRSRWEHTDRRFSPSSFFAK